MNEIRLSGVYRMGGRNPSLSRSRPLGSFLRAGSTALGATLFLFFFFIPHLWAFTVIEERMFSEGPYLFKMEVQVFGQGRTKKNPMSMTSLKVKIKNDRASSKTLQVKAIRAYSQPQVFQDMETKGFPITPAQWVTKYYRLPKKKYLLLEEGAFIEIAFDTFTIRFNPRERKFQGPIK